MVGPPARNPPLYALGLDFGTQSVRALFVSVADGREAGAGVAPYPSGEDGVLHDPRDPHLARQHPADYDSSLEQAVRAALAAARADREFDAERLIGIGIDATASTPLPVDGRCVPLACDPRFAGDLDACAWLWKDHTAHAEAEEITRAARQARPHYLAKCGGSYSSEWYFAKLLRALRVAPRVMAAAEGWVELGDHVAGLLTGVTAPRDLKRNTCAASHKALHHPSWGFPDADFLAAVDPRLGDWCRGRLPGHASPAGERAGGLSAEWAARLGLPAGTPVAVAGIDAHVGAVGAGIRPGRLVKILGTSACDLLVHPAAEPIADIPGISGIALGSILPDHHGLEAGQAAVGDLLAWFVREFGAPAGLTHEALTAEASRLRPGASGLLCLDWHHGNRNLLADPLLTGVVVGQTLRTRPAEVYRALIEATAFGARKIIERFTEHGVHVEEIVVCGGIAEKNPFFLQLYADILGRPIRRSRAGETCALGAAILGTAAAGQAAILEAERAMTGLKDGVANPDAAAAAVYGKLHALYGELHDAFGVPGNCRDLHHVMKELIAIRDAARRAD